MPVLSFCKSGTTLKYWTMDRQECLQPCSWPSASNRLDLYNQLLAEAPTAAAKGLRTFGKRGTTGFSIVKKRICSSSYRKYKMRHGNGHLQELTASTAFCQRCRMLDIPRNMDDQVIDRT
ncbi:hypothetical protein EJB05_36713, partial [Eragrostis curvula]